MDNLTHTLTAVALSRAGFNGKTRFATLALVAGANLPDVDLVARLRGGASYLEYHRGITHSILGITLLAGLLATTLYQLGQKAPPRKCGPPLDGRWLFAACWVATATHLLLDFTNVYGVRPFLPFNGSWYALDLVFVIDPMVWVFLVAGLGMPMLFRLVAEEVGSRKPDYRRGAIFSLVCLVLLWGLRGFAHRRALGQLDAHTYGQENPLRMGAFPSPGNPFAWTGVVETESMFHVLPVDVLQDGVNPGSARVFHKAEETPALAAAKRTRTAIIFSSFARFPWAQVRPGEEGFSVRIEDLRFFSATARRRGFVTEIELDKELRVRSESFSFMAPSGSRDF